MFCTPAEILRVTQRINKTFAAPRDRLSTNIKLELGLQLILTSLHEVVETADRKAVILMLLDRIAGPRMVVQPEPPKNEPVPTDLPIPALLN